MPPLTCARKRARPAALLTTALLLLVGCARNEEPFYFFTAGSTAGGSVKDQWTASVAVEDEPAPHPKRAPQRRAAQEPPAPKLQSDPVLKECANSQACLSQLKALLADPVRAWVGKPQPPRVYAKGVQLFAYRALRGELSCVELTTALSEIEAARRTLSGGGTGLGEAELARVRSLSAEVEGELRAERSRRCKA